MKFVIELVPIEVTVKIYMKLGEEFRFVGFFELCRKNLIMTIFYRMKI